jgi:hypothetical protein
MQGKGVTACLAAWVLLLLLLKIMLFINSNAQRRLGKSSYIAIGRHYWKLGHSIFIVWCH